MVLRADTRIDVTGSVPTDGEFSLAASVIAPADLDPARPPVVLFGFPGGGYGRRYYDLALPGLTGYSQAEYHAERGWVLVAVDHLGVGESSVPDQAKLTFEVLAAATDAAVGAALGRLTNGTLVDGLPPVRPGVVIGAGQSLGGAVVTVTQGRHQTFDAVALLGFSAIEIVLRTAPDTTATVDSGPVDYTALPEGESLIDENGFTYAFHWQDVPRDIVTADMGHGYPFRTRVPSWGSATTPPCAIDMMTPGFAAKEAGAITAPVFLGAGERDVLPDPWAEPTAFRGSHDITLFVAPRMAHMHNFAGTRELFWERLHGWGEQIRRPA
jgi:hypothetical protein